MKGKKVPMATKPRGGVGLSGRATNKRTFFAASLSYSIYHKLVLEKPRLSYSLGRVKSFLFTWETNSLNFAQTWMWGGIFINYIRDKTSFFFSTAWIIFRFNALWTSLFLTINFYRTLFFLQFPRFCNLVFFLKLF